MCGMTRSWTISEMNTLEGQQEWCKRPRTLQKNDSRGEENERGARSEKNARCGYTMEEKTRKDACKRDMTEVGLKEENTTNRAAWRNKITSYTGDPR